MSGNCQPNFLRMVISTICIKDSVQRQQSHHNLYYPQYEQDLNLHFVGVTRARKLCALITSTSRHNSKDVAKQSSPSEFLFLNGVEKMRKNYSY